MGDYYYSGYYVDKSYESARILYERAAEKGDSQAYLNLALMEEKGLIQDGCNLGSVEELYRKAEELGNTNALLIRGLKK
jgi:TPR repeat protein